MTHVIRAVGGTYLEKIHAGHPIFTPDKRQAKTMPFSKAQRITCQLKSVGYRGVAAVSSAIHPN